MLGPTKGLRWRAHTLRTLGPPGPTIVTPSARSLSGLKGLLTSSTAPLNGRETDHLGATRFAIPIATNLLDTDLGIATLEDPELTCVPRNAGKHEGIRVAFYSDVRKATGEVYRVHPALSLKGGARRLVCISHIYTRPRTTCGRGIPCPI